MEEDTVPQAAATRLAVAAEVAERAASAQVDGRMPAIYLGHGAPILVDDALWVAELAAWARALPRPRAILMVSAHWTEAPLTPEAPVTMGATSAGVPLVYDFYGFPSEYYETTYAAPPAPELAERVEALLGGAGTVARSPRCGLRNQVLGCGVTRR